MAKPLTKCPKCSTKITNRFECRNCGLIFDRYFKAEARKRKEAKARSTQKARTLQIVNTILAVLVVIILLGGGYYYLISKKEAPITTTQETPVIPDETSPGETPAVSQQPATPKPTTSTPAAGNSLAIAYSATVTIHTPWGQGTGFFIKEDKVLTNKHIVLYDEERLKKEEEQFEEKQKLLDTKKEKIQKAKEQAKNITDTEEKSALEAKIQEREKRLEVQLTIHNQKHEEISIMRQELKTPDIYILLHDGKKVHMAFMEVGSNHDLALLTVYDTEITPIQVADIPLSEETPVYSLGINKTSFNGTFKGHSDSGYIKTDRRINRSYSGGPLINNEGKAYGISVLPPTDQRDSGLAVPIDIAMREFGL